MKCDTIATKRSSLTDQLSELSGRLSNINDDFDWVSSDVLGGWFDEDQPIAGAS
jgi:hypothetical protein